MTKEKGSGGMATLCRAPEQKEKMKAFAREVASALKELRQAADS
jgi:hypothetical protein